jgi:hypothetical protein
MFPNQNPKLAINLRRLNNLMPILPNPPLNIIKLQLAFPNNLKQLPRSHLRQLTLSKSHWQRAHFAFNIQLFNRHGCRLKGDYFVAVNCPLNQFMHGGDFYAVQKVRLS